MNEVINPHTPDRFTPHTYVEQNIVDQRLLNADLGKNTYFFI